MADAVGMHNTSTISGGTLPAGEKATHVKFVVIVRFSKLIASCSCFSKSSISLFLKASLKEPKVLVALLLAVVVFFAVSTTSSSIFNLLSQVFMALIMLPDMSTSVCVAPCCCLSTSAPIFSKMSSSCSSKSINLFNSFGASDTSRRKRRISRTESTSWIASDTTAMPLAAALRPSISEASDVALYESKKANGYTAQCCKVFGADERGKNRKVEN